MDSEVILFYINGIHSNLGPAHDNDHQIIQKMVITITSAQSEHILTVFFIWLVLLSLSSALRVSLFSYTTYKFSSWCPPDALPHLAHTSLSK